MVCFVGISNGDTSVGISVLIKYLYNGSLWRQNIVLQIHPEIIATS